MMILLDTNVLIHAYSEASIFRERAASILLSALTGDTEAVVAPQNLYEFYSVATNPKRVKPPLSCEEAAEICRTIHESPELVKIHPSENTPITALSLAEEQRLDGARIFDCVLAATAKENGVEIIYTQNVEDFRGFGFLKVIDPFDDATD